MHAHSATISGHVRTYACGILECRPRYIYIYIFKISMSHDLRVSSLAATRDARIALVGRASSQWSFQCAPPSLMII